MPRGHELIRYILAQYLRALFRPIMFSLRFPRKRLYGKKKIVVPCLDVIMSAFSPRNIH